MKIDTFKRKELASWFIIVFFGAILRLYPLVTKSFWEDELWTYRFSLENSTIFQPFIHPIDDRPPLFYLLTKLFTLINTSEIFLRFPGFLASILAIVIIGISIRKHSKYIALATIFLLSTSLFLIDMSWQFRDYGILSLCTALSIRSFLEIWSDISMRRRLSNKKVVGLSMTFLFGTLINYLYLPFVGSMILGTILMLWMWNASAHRREACTKLILSTLPSLGIALYYLPRQTTSIQMGTTWIPHPSLLSYLSLLTSFTGLTDNFQAITSGNQAMMQNHAYMVLALGICIFVSIMISNHTRRATPLLFLASISLTAFFINLAGIEIASYFLGTSLFLPKTFLPGAIILIFGCTIYITTLLRQTMLPKYLPVISGLLGCIYLSHFLNLYTGLYTVMTLIPKTNDPTKEILNIVQSRYVSGDQIVMLPLHYNTLYFPYYLRRYINQKADKLQNAIAHSEPIAPTLSSIPAHHIMFIAHSSIFKPNQTDYLKDYVTLNKEAYERAAALCEMSPQELWKNDIWTMSICTIRQ